MSEANKEVFKSVGAWFTLVMFPILFLGLLYDELIINVIIEFNSPKSLLLFMLAGIFFAVQDTLAHHYSTSVFKNMNAQWWNAEISWLNKYELLDGISTKTKRKIKLFGKKTIFNIPVQFTDGWHLFKMLSILCCAGSVIFYEPIFSYKIVDFLFYGFWFNLYFVMFYSRILKSK